MPFSRNTLTAGVFLACLTAATTALAATTKLVGVTAQGGPTAQIFPFFIAMENGYYAAEGLDVEMKYSRGSSDAARQLAAGNVDFGVFSAAAAMQTTQRGFPLKVIYQVYYPDTFDIVVPVESDIETMADMQGLTLGLSDLAGGEVPMVRASLAETGLVEGQDVAFVAAGEGDPTTVRSFSEERIQAYAGAKRDILLIPAQGIPVRSITPAAIAAFPGDGLAVRTETFEEDPETLVKLVRATLKGWAWGVANPDATFDLLREKYAAASLGDNPVAAEFWQLVLDYYTAPDSVTHHGTPIPVAWDTYMAFLQLGEEEQKALAGPVDLDALLTDAIVLEAWQGLDVTDLAKAE